MMLIWLKCRSIDFICISLTTNLVVCILPVKACLHTAISVSLSNYRSVYLVFRRYSVTHRALFKQTNKAGMILISVLLLLLVMLTACGGSSSSAKKKPAHPNSLTMQANQTDAYPRNFNPYSPSVISGTQGLIYETLLNVNRLNGDIKPWLASSYQLASDAQSITFHLRQHVTWSDGQPFTSADVLFTLNLLTKNASVDLTGVGAVIKDVSAPDASTV